MTLPQVITGLIALIFGGAGGGMFGVWLKHRMDARAADREDRAEPLVLGKGVVELTAALQQVSMEAVNAQREEVQQYREEARQLRDEVSQSRAEVRRARADLGEARIEIKQQQQVIVEHKSLIERLTARVKQLVELLAHHKIEVPEDPYHDR